MKSFVLISFIFLLLSCSPKGNEPVAALKTCRLQEVKTSQGAIGTSTKYTYNNVGLLVLQSDSGSVVWDGSTSGIYLTTYTYDKNDYLLTKETALNLLDVNGKLIRSPDKYIESFKYNTEGQLISNYHYDTGGRFNAFPLTDTYEYSGLQIKQITINSNGERRIIKFNAGIPSELIRVVLNL